jgi:hypothetical protein
VTKESNRRMIGADELPVLLSEFSHKPAKLTSAYHELCAMPCGVVVTERGIQIVFRDVVRKKRFTTDHMQPHAEEWRVIVGPRAVFELFDKGKQLYVALVPSVNSITFYR